MAALVGLFSLLNQINTVLQVVNEFLNTNTQKANELRERTGLDIKLDVVLVEQNGKKDLALVLRGLPDVWDTIVSTLIDAYTEEKVEVLKCQRA